MFAYLNQCLSVLIRGKRIGPKSSQTCTIGIDIIHDPAQETRFAPTIHIVPSTPSTRLIRVVCAVIEDRDARVLLAQRPTHKHLGAKWEFAGGKIEPGETPEAALQREIKEELGCDIIIGRALRPFTHDYGTVLIEMLPFICSLTDTSSPPHPHEHIAVSWVALADIGTFDLAPADWPLVAMLRARNGLA
jgi:8-oxo-dGTP diphosphatase